MAVKKQYKVLDESAGEVGAVIDLTVAEAKKLGEAVELVKTQEDSASVYDANGALIRTYTLEKHGEDYAELAEGFASKVAGRTVK